MALPTCIKLTERLTNLNEFIACNMVEKCYIVSDIYVHVYMYFFSCEIIGFNFILFFFGQ